MRAKRRAARLRENTVGCLPPDRQESGPPAKTAVIIVVVLVVAAAILVISGQPVPASIELIALAAFVAVEVIKRLTPRHRAA